MTRFEFAHALAAEWTKFRTVRSSVWLLVTMAGMIVGIAVFVGATESLQPDDTILGGSVGGAVAAQIAVGALGALIISAEYGTGTIRTTLAACPGRATVVTAKAVVIAVVGLVATLIACPIAYLIGRLMLSGEGYASGDAMPALIGVAICIAITGVLGLAIGTMLRHSAGAVTTVIAIVLVPALFGPLFGDLQPWVVGASPLTVLQKLTQSSDAASDTAGSLGAWPSLGILAACTLTAFAFSARMLQRRDA